MHDRRPIKAAGLGLVSAGLLLTAAPSALAANVTGGFSYGTGDSSDAAVTIHSPATDRCYPTMGAASTADNKTGISAQVFKDSDCKHLVASIAPGRSDNRISFASVKFTDQAPIPAPLLRTKR